jgi:hypothetical protein
VLEHDKVRMEFVVTSTESTGELHQMRVTYAPHSDLPPSHIHPAQDETFETPALRTGEFFMAMHDAASAGDIDRLVAVIAE